MTIGYGIIGTGMMGIEHAMNLKILDGVEIVAVSDPNPEPRDWIRPVLAPSTAILTDTEELLGRSDVDVAVIASLNGAKTSRTLPSSFRFERPFFFSFAARMAAVAILVRWAPADAAGATAATPRRSIRVACTMAEICRAHVSVAPRKLLRTSACP